MAAGLSDSNSATSLYLVGALVLLGVAVLGRLREYFRLRHFKGPATSGISWWWHSKAVISGRAHEYYGDVTEKYGMQERFLVGCVY